MGPRSGSCPRSRAERRVRFAGGEAVGLLGADCAATTAAAAAGGSGGFCAPAPTSSAGTCCSGAVGSLFLARRLRFVFGPGFCAAVGSGSVGRVFGLGLHALSRRFRLTSRLFTVAGLLSAHLRVG